MGKLPVLAYARESVPTTEERRAVPDGTRWRNAQAWAGETEPAALVISHRADVRAAYEAAGVRCRAFDVEVRSDPQAPAPDLNATPAAVRLALAEGLDLTEVAGSGAGGRITKADVEAALA